MNAMALVKMELPSKVVANILGVTPRCVRKARRGEPNAISKISKLGEVEHDVDELQKKSNEFIEESQRMHIRRDLRSAERRLEELFDDWYMWENLDLVPDIEACILEYYKVKAQAKKHNLSSNTWKLIKKWKDSVEKVKNLPQVQQRI